MLRKKVEERMHELRGLTRLEELASRIVTTWEEAYAGAKQDIKSDVSCYILSNRSICRCER